VIIDAHQHLWHPGDRTYPWMSGVDRLDRPYLVEDLRSAMAGTGVASTVLVQALSSDEETDWLLELARDSPEIGAVVGWVDLQGPAVDDRVRDLVETSGKFRGVRHQLHDEADADWLTRPQVLNGLESVGRAGLTFDLLIGRAQAAAALTAATVLADVTFVLDHSGNPFEGDRGAWRKDLSALAARPNVFCKLSALVRANPADAVLLRETIETVVDAFGPERCMYGSDWPVSLLAAAYGDVLAAVQEATAWLSETEREAIFAGTARRAYGLG
jgi:L-fuconolactonase